MDRGISAPIRLSSRIQHILNKNSVSPCRIIYKHMGHGAHKLTILNNRAAAHALDYAAGFGQQLRVGDGQHGMGAAGFPVNPVYLN